MQRVISNTISNSSNANVVTDYLDAMQTETNLSKNYGDLIKFILNKLSRFHKDKLFARMKRDDIVSFLNSFRKSDKADPLHKWIGTYNTYLVCISRFFRWLENPDLEPRHRPKPQRIQNIPRLKRKETSIYKPSDLWTLQDDLLFLKWCHNKRDQCYHTVSRDLSARPHEILNLKIKDLILKNAGNKQYAEVLVNGKTGSRHLPLIDSLPYIKQWLDHHPQRNNPQAYFICSLNRETFAQQMKLRGLQYVYKHYRDSYFPRLLKDPTVPKEDKQHIRELLLKPWNPYLRRHSSLTQKSKFLKEHILRQHAGWTPNSQMHLKYVHYFGNESSESILQEYGILPKNNEEMDVLRPKQCTNCNEYNRPDQKFCVKCRFVLTIEAFHDTLKEQNDKDLQILKLTEQMADMQQAQEEMRVLLRNPKKLREMVLEGN